MRCARPKRPLPWLAVCVILAATDGQACGRGAAQRRAPDRTVVRASSSIVSLPTGQSYYVAPSGSPNGDGSFENAWDLQTALSQPAGMRPGDTIWLRGGTYAGTFVGKLNGAPASPIVVRQYPGERAIIDGGNSSREAILYVSGSYTWYWGFEVMSSDPKRVSAQTGSSPTDIGRGEGIFTVQSSGTGTGLKVINLIIHDTAQAFGFWKEAVDAEISGCLIYYNGWDAPDRGHGHGIYTQNQTGIKTIKDNIVFANYSHGLHAYGSGSAHLNNIRVEGNTFFQNGDLSAVSGARNLLIGGGSVAQNPTVTSNYLYRLPGGPSSDFDLGYSAGCANPRVTDNYIVGNTEFVNCSNITMTGNTFYGAVEGFSPPNFPTNTYPPQRPSGTLVFVRPNQYEPGRANITVFNWSLASTVNVDLTGVLTVGSSYEIRNAQDYFATPVVTGTYAGGTLALPMSGLSVEAPVGVATPPATGPEFNAFVLLSTGVGRTAPSAPKSVRPKARTLDRRS